MISRSNMFVVFALVGAIGFAAEVSHGALASRAGGSALSGKLARNKALRRQQVIVDPEEPISGSISVSYNPSLVTLTDLTFGPGYTGSGQVELDNTGEGTPNLPSFLASFGTKFVREESSFGLETGYAKVTFSEDEGEGSEHGELTPDPGFEVIDTSGPAAVDIFSLFFDYLDGVPDSAIATYVIYADSGARGGEPDFLSAVDENGPYTVSHDQIAPAVVSGSLTVIPLPPAAWIGGVTLLGMLAIGKLRQRKLA